MSLLLTSPENAGGVDPGQMERRCVYPNCTVMVPAHLFQLHLNYCRRKWCGPFVTCPYNITHRYGQPEDEFHRQTCQDKFETEEKDNKNDQNIVETVALAQNDGSFSDEKLRKCQPQNRHNLVTLTKSADLFAISPSVEAQTTNATARQMSAESN